MKHYFFILLLACFYLKGCAMLDNADLDGSLYNDCYEYYDARGIYHNTCKEEKKSD